MPTHNAENVLNLPTWFKETCQSSEVHKDLYYFKTLFEKHLSENKVMNIDDIELYEKLKAIDSNIDLPECDYLYAYSIETLKMAAFLEISNGAAFVSECYAMIKSIWDKRCPDIKSKKNNFNYLMLIGF